MASAARAQIIAQRQAGLLKLKPGWPLALMMFCCSVVTAVPLTWLCRGRRQRLHVRQQRAIEQQRILQAELDAELIGVVEPHFGDQHLDQHHRRPLVELLDDLDDFVVEPRRRADDQAVGGQLRAR